MRPFVNPFEYVELTMDHSIGAEKINGSEQDLIRTGTVKAIVHDNTEPQCGLVFIVLNLALNIGEHIFPPSPSIAPALMVNDMVVLMGKLIVNGPFDLVEYLWIRDNPELGTYNAKDIVCLRM
tara:strand:+ start:578 stop:946 length:369 start_codon:yes stop_codon:yes gene_type:complete